MAGIGKVFKGFDEMALLMREGNNVVARLLGPIAYGERGSGDVIPPNATLVYFGRVERDIDGVEP